MKHAAAWRWGPGHCTVTEETKLWCSDPANMGFGLKEQDFTVCLWAVKSSTQLPIKATVQQHTQQGIQLQLLALLSPLVEERGTSSVQRGCQEQVWKVTDRTGTRGWVQTVMLLRDSAFHRYTGNQANPGSDKWAQFPFIYHHVGWTSVHMLARPHP